MTSHRATPGVSAKRMAECICGHAFPDPWDLVAHFLAAYPPSADQPRDGNQHGDVTRLAVKLDQGATGAWEVGTWATSDRKSFRVAAALTRKYGGRINITGDDIDTTLAARHPAGHMLHLIAGGTWRCSKTGCQP